MNTALLDGDKLKKIANSSQTAQIVALSLAMRERLRHTSDIVRTKNALIRSGERIVESDYEQFWEDLQAAKAGSIIYGRNGKADRFKWHYSLKKIATACFDGKDVKADTLVVEESPKNKKTVKVDKVDKPAPAKTFAGESLVYVPLRSNFEIEIKVPSDLTKDEVEVLTRALNRRAI